MSQRSDWLPAGREGIVATGRIWLIIIAANLQKWGIPESALDDTRNESTRAPVATARCKEAFHALSGKMRDIKKRYFLSPPLADADFVSLGHAPRHHPHSKQRPTLRDGTRWA